ncbi:MAG: radical SAM protein [Candidatus Omnitrophica bacterium]|nr:radical SAM protein [Candidatus Omnitrophota bacterium]
MRIKKKIIFCGGVGFLRKELFKNLSLLTGMHLFRPPQLIDVRMTLRCNLRCEQCHVWKRTDYPELSTQLWKKIISDIKSYIGSYFIKFYGGEPFCRTDFLEIVHYCSHNDICSTMTTNGSLITKHVANELAKNQVAGVTVSLDGSKPQTHDKLRGVSGTYRKVLNAIEYLQGKVPLQINTTILDDNIDEILELADFAYKNKIPISFQGVINIIDGAYRKDRMYDFENDSYLFPKDIQKACYVIDELSKRKKKYKHFIMNSNGQLHRLKCYYQHSLAIEKRTCESQNNHLFIYSDGSLSPCCFYKNFGNLKEKSFIDIWKSKEMGQKIFSMNNCDKVTCLIMRGCHRETLEEFFSKVKQCFV